MAPSGSPAAGRGGRAEIDAQYERLDRTNHFELLGVERDTPPQQLKAAYVAAAKKWHVDAWAGAGLDPASQQKVQAIFKQVREAHEVLSDPAARAEYLVQVDRKAKGLSTDVSAILRGESKIDEGLGHLGQKRWAPAEAAFAEAKALNKDDPLIWAHHAYARYRARRGGAAALAEAKPEFERALKAQPNLPEALEYLGTLHFELEDFAAAKRYLKRCLEISPRNVAANRLLRLANARAEKQSKRPGLLGFVDKLLGK